MPEKLREGRDSIVITIVIVIIIIVIVLIILIIMININIRREAEREKRQVVASEEEECTNNFCEEEQVGVLIF